MQIKQDEIKETKNIGKLFGSDVKLLSLKGGFHIGMGKKEKNSNKTEIIAVGSHPAIIAHQIEKKYQQDFEQKMAKSEKDSLPSVVELSKNLTSSEKNVFNLDIYALKKDETVEFKITKNNFEIFSIKASENNKEIVLEKTEKHPEKMARINIKNLSKSLEKGIKEYASKNNLKIKRNF